MKRKIVVLGSNSFSGSHFIDHLIEKGGFGIVGVSRSREKDSVFLPYKRHNGKAFSFEQIDVNTQQDKLFKLIDRIKPDYIINFAGLVEVSSSWTYPREYFQTNCLSVVSLADFLKAKPYLKRYVQISTPEVYGTTEGSAREDTRFNPSTPYAASKAAADLYLLTLYKNFQFPVVFVRSTNVYGPGQQSFRIIPKTIISIKKGIKIPLEGGGKAIKSYIHIQDVSRGELTILLNGKNGEVYHISPPSSISIRDLVEMICRKLGVSFEESVDIVGDRVGQDKAYVLDSGKIRKLGWKPNVSLTRGVAEIIEWVNTSWKTLQSERLSYTHRY